jgi:hypothetical protein
MIITTLLLPLGHIPFKVYIRKEELMIEVMQLSPLFK